MLLRDVVKVLVEGSHLLLHLGLLASLTLLAFVVVFLSEEFESGLFFDSFIPFYLEGDEQIYDVLRLQGLNWFLGLFIVLLVEDLERRLLLVALVRLLELQVKVRHTLDSLQLALTLDFGESFDGCLKVIGILEDDCESVFV